MTLFKSTSFFVAPVCTALVLISTNTLAQEQDNWRFMLEPYLMGTAIEGDSGIGQVQDVELDVGFDTIVENLDFGAMVKGEIQHRSGWGLAFDYAIMDLKADANTNRGGVLDARVKQAVSQVALFHRIQLGADESYDLMIGARHWENKLRLKLDPALAVIPQQEISKEPDWTDGYIGGRYIFGLNDNWNGLFYGDVGSGDSDFTATLQAGLFYQFSDTWALELSYKATWVDYEEGTEATRDYFAYDTVTHGPIVGLVINF